MGALFLYRLPHLETIQLYRVALPPQDPLSLDQYLTHHNRNRYNRAPAIVPDPDLGPGASDADDDVRDLIIPWRKHCRDLREIQFEENSVWRRAFDGDEWCKRLLEPAPRAVTDQHYV